MPTDKSCLTAGNAPIGFFDSGIGGLTLLAEAKKLLPTERFIYIADTAHMPYGQLSDKQIFRRAEICMEYLQCIGCKAVVIACNTATACAAQMLRRIFSFPIIGIEPAVKPAVKYAKGGSVVMLATPATIRSRHYMQGIDNIKPVACTELAAFIEYNYGDNIALKKYVAALLESKVFVKAQAIVLGCTHYVIVKDLFNELLPADVKIFDGNLGTAARLLKIITSGNMYNTEFSYKRDSVILTGSDNQCDKYGDVYCDLLKDSVRPFVRYMQM